LDNRIFTVRNRKRFARSTGDTWQATPCTEIWATANFKNVAMQAGVEMGGWSWSTDAWDFDHDGYQDRDMANGYITGHDGRDASSFFWRQVVSKSPQYATPSESYERGWNAINELIRSDATWNGFERNVFYLNNRMALSPKSPA